MSKTGVRYRVARVAERPLPTARAAWAFFLDFDGTLVDLAATPDDVRVDDGVMRLVQALQRVTAGATAIVSGRAVASLDRLLPIPALAVAGQHGLERRRGDGALMRHGASESALDGAREFLARALRDHTTLLLEDKGHSLALHYRRSPSLASFAHQALREARSRAIGDFRLQRGKRVIELAPATVDKGQAVRDFMLEVPFRGRRPVFVGDDESDEAGFEAVNAMGGVSIKVGSGRTTARWALANSAEVRAWLEAAVDHESVDASSAMAS